MSYVWGSSKFHELTSDGQLPSRLPKTIEDAITVAKNLGITYLWIDRYCIDQGESEERHHAIRNMSQIYRDAYVTIIASAGDGPEHGLPGVGDTFRSPFNRIVIGRHLLESREAIHNEINDSKWGSRGWTYQEALMSRRRLVFASSHIYFECLEMGCWESTRFPLVENKYLMLFEGSGITRDAMDIYPIIQNFLPRQLSFESDRLNAIQGIFTSFKGAETNIGVYRLVFQDHFWGIPVLSNNRTNEPLEDCLFKYGLLFRIHNGRLGKGCSLFPSWSWASQKLYDGTCEFPHFTHFTLGGAFWSVTSTWSRPSIRVTTTTGVQMNIGSFARQSLGYRHFLPCLDLRGWSIWTKSSVDPPVESSEPRFIEKSYERLVLENGWSFWDYGPAWQRGKLLLFFIQAYLISNPVTNFGVLELGLVQVWCLLLEEKTPGVFRRVGVWQGHVTIEGYRDTISEEEFFLEHLKPTFSGADPRWAKRTVRVE